MLPKNVLGEEIVHDEGGNDSTDPLTLEEFATLAAGDQKELLQRLQIDGDASNTEKRLELYAAYLTPLIEGGGE